MKNNSKIFRNGIVLSIVLVVIFVAYVCVNHNQTVKQNSNVETPNFDHSLNEKSDTVFYDIDNVYVHIANDEIKTSQQLKEFLSSNHSKIYEAYLSDHKYLTDDENIYNLIISGNKWTGGILKSSEE